MRHKSITKAKAVFLEPRKVGSSIGYRLNAYTYYNDFTKSRVKSFDGEITLTDCNEHITWGGYHDGFKGLKHFKTKLIKAIDVLTSCLNDLEVIEKEYNKWPTETSKKGKEQNMSIQIKGVVRRLTLIDPETIDVEIDFFKLRAATMRFNFTTPSKNVKGYSPGDRVIILIDKESK